jgi:hypothetical protein
LQIKTRSFGCVVKYSIVVGSTVFSLLNANSTVNVEFDDGGKHNKLIIFFKVSKIIKEGGKAENGSIF